MQHNDGESGIHQGQRVHRGGVAATQARAALILIHGRGAPARTMIPVAEALAGPKTTVLIPEAAGHVWYPQRFIAPLDENEPFLSSALQVIGDLLAELETQGIPAERVVLGGFSQGACLSSEYAARNPRRYGGILAFSGGLIGPIGMEFTHSGSLDGTPAFVGCSDSDFHIPLERVHDTTRVLRDLGAEVDERIYSGMGHTIVEDELEAAAAIIRAVESDD